MNEIVIPQSNPNDDFVFISEWKFKNNEFVKKGDHVLSIETSKVIEEIHSDNNGYLEILYDLEDKVKVGEVVALLHENKNFLKKNNKKIINQITFTKKAKELMQVHKIEESAFLSKTLVKESDVIKLISDQKKNFLDQLIILKKNNHPYHVAIYLKNIGIVDLSLLGSNITKKVSEYNFGGCNCEFFRIEIKNKKNVLSFINKPALLTDKIIKKEKSSKGWTKKIESANFILQFRDKRSKSLKDMNCVEWIVYALELGGLNIPENVLTADRLKNWADKNLKKILKENNLEEFKEVY